MRPQKRPSIAAENILEEANERKEEVVARTTIAREAAERIAASLEATGEAVVIALSPHRPSFRQEEVIVLLESTTWLGRTVALQGLLEPMSKMSVSMQIVNVLPWELMAEQQAFYDKLVFMEAAFWEPDSPETDSRWSSTMPDPIPAKVFPFFHEELDLKHHPSETQIQMLMRGTYTGQQPKVPDEDRRDGITDA